jgi:hypothetical protein
VEVTLGRRDKEWIELTAALPEGAKIITSGLTQIVEGTAVKLRE